MKDAYKLMVILDLKMFEIKFIQRRWDEQKCLWISLVID